MKVWGRPDTKKEDARQLIYDQIGGNERSVHTFLTICSTTISPRERLK